MSKAISKVLALSLASLILFSNLSFLNASSLDIAEKPTSNSNEQMVEKTEVQVPEADSANTTDTKVVASKVKNTKKVLVSETKDVKELDALEVKDTEEVTAQETDNKEKVVTVTPVDEEAPQVEEEVVIPAEPVEAEPEVAPVEDETTEISDEEAPQVEPEVVIPAKPVEAEPEVAPVEDETTEVSDEEAPQVEPEVVIPAEPVEAEPEVAPVEDETTEVSDEEAPQVEEEVVIPAEPVEAEPEVAPVEDETTEVSDEEAPQVEEEVVIPAKPVEAEPEVAPVEDETTEVSDEEAPQVEEEVVIPAEPVEAEPEVAPVEEQPEEGFGFEGPEIFTESYEPNEYDEEELSVPDQEPAEEPENATKSADAKDGTRTPCPGLENVPDILDTNDVVIHVIVDEEHYYEPEDGQWTESTEVDSDITVTYKGPYWYVSCAKFECDLSMCEGFGGADSQYISRRGGCEVTVTAPQAKDGFVFVGWEKVENERDGYIEVYKAVYEQEANAELSMLELNEEVVPDDLFVSSGPIQVKDCEHDKPDDGEYTTMVSGANERTIKIKYQACNGIVTATKFKCELPIFGGSKEVIETYRGGVEISKEAPEKVDGYVFEKWVKRDPERIPNTTKSSWEVYEAVYVPEAEVKADANVATNLFQEPAVSVADVTEIAGEETMADAAEVTSETAELTCECKTKGHQWDEKNPRTCTCEHCKESAKGENKVWWDCFSSDDAEDTKTPRAGAIWWVNFKCDLSQCEGFDGYLGVDKTGEVSEGRRASVEKYKMKAPTPNSGFKFKGWYIGDEFLTDDEELTVCWKLMDMTIEARYE